MTSAKKVGDKESDIMSTRTRTWSVLLCAPVALLGTWIMQSPAPIDGAFGVSVLAGGLDQPTGLALAPSASKLGGELFVTEAGRDRIVKIAQDGTVSVQCCTLGAMPVSLICPEGAMGQYLFVGDALTGGIECHDAVGGSTQFALAGCGIADLAYGSWYPDRVDAADLFAFEWRTGDVWRVDAQGNAAVFAAIPMGPRLFARRDQPMLDVLAMLPRARLFLPRTRLPLFDEAAQRPQYQDGHMAFSKGAPFGRYLYVTDSVDGDIYRIGPDGVPAVLARTRSPGLEALAFSPGGGFGKFLYVGNTTTGEILQVAHDGTVVPWASGFAGVADLQFGSDGGSGFRMYVADGIHSVFVIETR
jgi:hypothetical protein